MPSPACQGCRPLRGVPKPLLLSGRPNGLPAGFCGRLGGHRALAVFEGGSRRPRSPVPVRAGMRPSPAGGVPGRRLSVLSAVTADWTARLHEPPRLRGVAVRRGIRISRESPPSNVAAGDHGPIISGFLVGNFMLGSITLSEGQDIARRIGKIIEAACTDLIRAAK
jgi:hypothetical protein